jgi:uncharacterized protein (DUF1697 family)
MTTYIALLRGINVGTNSRVKMTDLKALCESLCLSSVETYIQSGNVIFEVDETEAILAGKLEKAIETEFGFSSSVIIRTAEELEQIIRGYPFSEEEVAEAESANTEGESRYIALLTQQASKDMLARLDKYKNEQDKYVLIGRNMYLLFHHSIRNSKLAIHLDKLGIPLTVRNWKTIKQLFEMVKLRRNM